MALRNLAFAFLLLSLLVIQSYGQQCSIVKPLTVKCKGLKNVGRFNEKYLSAKSIDLSKNKIEVIPANVFQDFTKLEHINISRNAIHRVSSGAFSNVIFKWIDLSHNKLTSIGRAAFPSDKNLATLKTVSGLYLHHNPWHCTCELKWMVDFIRDGTLKSLGSPPACATPQKLKGKKLNELGLHDYCVIKECIHCDDAADCKKNGTKYACVCKPTYNGNGEFCADIDECAQRSTNNCKKYEICENVSGSYKCICPSGFKEEKGECKDIDECKPNPVGCGPGQGVCRNTIGSYKCQCHAGLQYVEGRGCIDLDECKTDEDPCKNIANSKCVNTAIKHHGDQGYRCKCVEGYMQVGEACIRMGDSTTMYIIIAGIVAVFVICIIIIIIVAVLCRKYRKEKSDDTAMIMAPMGMAAPLEFAYMDMPQDDMTEDHADAEEWKDEEGEGDDEFH